MIVTKATKAHAREILDYIAAHPEEHDQSVFMAETSCGTTMCIAGTSCFLAEDNVTLTPYDYPWIDKASKRLGLSPLEAHNLFLDTIPSPMRGVSVEVTNKYAVMATEAIAAGDQRGFWDAVDEFLQFRMKTVEEYYARDVLDTSLTLM